MRLFLLFLLFALSAPLAGCALTVGTNVHPHPLRAYADAAEEASGGTTTYDVSAVKFGSYASLGFALHRPSTYAHLLYAGGGSEVMLTPSEGSTGPSPELTIEDQGVEIEAGQTTGIRGHLGLFRRTVALVGTAGERSFVLRPGVTAAYMVNPYFGLSATAAYDLPVSGGGVVLEGPGGDGDVGAGQGGPLLLLRLAIGCNC